MLYPSRRIDGFPGRFIRPRFLNKGALVFDKSFLVVSPTRLTVFGYVFYNDMKKKPVAQLFCQRLMLPLRAVNGLLLQDTPAIVVNCFAHSFKFEVRHV